MTSKTLYCVLNWGLGHASRSIPIIKRLLSEGKDISIASDGLPLQLLQDAFPELPSYELPPYDINYKYESIAANLLGQCIKIIRAIKKENKSVSSLVEQEGFDTIISDNRFGCYHSQCKNIFITHQLRLIHHKRFIQAAATKMNLGMIAKFDECWIPDSENSGLSGVLSSKVELDIPTEYIGIQSRFPELPCEANPDYLSISILSGPEPQRSILQEKIESQLVDIPGQHVIVSGSKEGMESHHNIKIKPMCSAAELASLIRQSKYIISRSGYSSLMDYQAMKRRAILIPTPGQTEQEYLGLLAAKDGRHIVLAQDRMKLAEHLL